MILYPGEKSPHASEIFTSPLQASQLSLLSAQSVTPANIGRRRQYTATMLSSPARQGHSSCMLHIFREAAASLAKVKSEAEPTIAVRKDSVYTACTIQKETPAINDVADEELVQYPKLPYEPDFPSPLTDRHVGQSPMVHKPGNTGRLLFSPKPKKVQLPQSTETIRPQHALQLLGRPKPVNFEQITNMFNDGYENNYTGASSISSGSWSGDSEFFVRTPPKVARKVVLEEAINQDTTSSVSKWLELLPDDPSETDEEAVVLSPTVELGRGSMRKKLREWDRKDQCTTFDDEDSFLAGED